MLLRRSSLPVFALLALAAGGCTAPDGSDKSPDSANGTPAADGPTPAEVARQAAAKRAAEQARLAAEALEREFPLHGAVTGTELKVLAKPNTEATVIGWLRVGSRVRLAGEPVKVRGCSQGFYRISPSGHVCKGAGLKVAQQLVAIDAPGDLGWKQGQLKAAEQRGAVVLPAAARDEALPYDYYLVKETAVPAYHRLPSRAEQRAAHDKADYFRALMKDKPDKAKRYMAGELKQGPGGTAITARYLEHKFFVASNGSEVRANRRFVRTSGGGYVKLSQLKPIRAEGAFAGVELGDQVRLPIAWTVRESHPLHARPLDDGTLKLRRDPDAAPIARMVLLNHWQGLRRMGGSLLHELSTPAGPRYLKSWFAAVARQVEPPAGVPPGASWVHVDLEQQTAVLYEQGRPVYATLVSSGIEGHTTPTGVFRIRRKRVTDTMADLGPEAGDDRYRIEDVPWTQYFEGSFALHAAFWHQRFGLPRSHGCVNLSPPDAHRIFQGTLPRVPRGWHGLSTDGTQYEGSPVVITDQPLGAINKTAAPGADAPVPAGAPANPGEGAAAKVQRGPPDPRGIAAGPKSIEPWRRRKPTEVKYTIARGASARRVANLFKVHPARIAALNPELKDLDKELGPGTELVVYRHSPDKRSRSIGKAQAGRIENGAPMPDGHGRILKASRDTLWATRRTVGLLDAVLRGWAQLEPKAQPILVGAMSLPKGGRFPPHSTHQSGRDVDLGYPQMRKEGEKYNWRNMDARNLDLRRTWRLLHMLQATGELELVFMDRALQQLLHDHAVKKNLLSDEQLAQWLEYPRAPGDGSPIVQHVPGHVDHLHVRFTCGQQAGCE